MFKWNKGPGEKSFVEQVQETAQLVASRKGKRGGHSSFWLNEDSIRAFDDDKVDKKSVEFALQLRNVQRGVANFVRILTGRNIPVHFSTGQQSYATVNEHVVISATTDPKKIDVTVGTALHEGGHLCWSKRYENCPPESIPLYAVLDTLHTHSQGFITPAMRADMARLNLNVRDANLDIQRMLNVLEDRRIDKLVYQKNPGYRGYYEAFYDEYWHSPQNDYLFYHPVTRLPVLKNYRWHIINMSNRYADCSALPGLEDIWNLVDLDNIERFQSDAKWDDWTINAVMRNQEDGTMMYNIAKLPEMLRSAVGIVALMYKHAKRSDELTEEDKKNAKKRERKRYYGGKWDGQNMDRNDMTSDEMEDADIIEYDVDGGTGLDIDAKIREADKTSDKDAQKAQDASLDKENKVLDGKVDKESIDDTTANDIKSLDASDAHMKVLEGQYVEGAKVIVYGRLTRGLLDNSSFPFAQRDGSGLAQAVYGEAVSRGAILGAMLANKIKVMADESVLIISRQKNGKIDRHLLHQLGPENYSIFYRSEIERMSPVYTHLSLDASGSMCGEKWNKALTLATALAMCAQKIRNLDVVISIRAGGSSECAYIAIVYDSRVDRFPKALSLFPYLTTAGSTPEGLCYEATMERILSGKPEQRKFFVNVSDGEPTFYIQGHAGHKGGHYTGHAAYKHTRLQCDRMRAAGITILAYYVNHGYHDDSIKAFREMYGKSASYVDCNNLIEVANTLNRLYMQEEND